jgi:hypothetical protein
MSERSCCVVRLVPWQTCVAKYPAKYEYSRLPYLLEMEHLLQNAPKKPDVQVCSSEKNIFYFYETEKVYAVHIRASNIAILIRFTHSERT